MVEVLSTAWTCDDAVWGNSTFSKEKSAEGRGGVD